MAKSKIVYFGEVLMDLTGDTVTPDKLLKGVTAHDKEGEQIEGTCTYDVDSTDATANPAEILKGKTAYVRGAKVTGDMPNNGAVKGSISTKDGKYTVPQGYHDGSGTVEISETERAKLVPDNIRQGVSVLGVSGNMSGMEGVKAQTKSVTPGKNTQTVLPDNGYNYLSQVEVAAIPYTETPNSAGGITVTVG